VRDVAEQTGACVLRLRDEKMRRGQGTSPPPKIGVSMMPFLQSCNNCHLAWAQQWCTIFIARSVARQTIAENDLVILIVRVDIQRRVMML